MELNISAIRSIAKSTLLAKPSNQGFNVRVLLFVPRSISSITEKILTAWGQRVFEGFAPLTGWSLLGVIRVVPAIPAYPVRPESGATAAARVVGDR